MIVLGFPGSTHQAAALARRMSARYATVEVHRFPDGESRVRLPSDLPDRAILYSSLDHPNDKLVELMLAAGTARELGIRHLTLVAPYLCYMRQDMAFHPGEAVSQRIVGRFLAQQVDRLVTVDPHLHRVANLGDAVPARETLTLSAAVQMGGFLAGRPGHPVLLGPDEESAQWVSVVAAVAGMRFAVARKQRQGDRSVRIELPDLALENVDVVLVDDMAATGRTLCAATREVQEAGASSVSVLVTHPLFVGSAEAELRAAGVDALWSTDSITHPSNVIPLAGVIADALSDRPGVRAE